MALVRVIKNARSIILFNNIMSSSGNQIQNGRWRVPNTENYQEITNLILDRSNEDHCGSCGDYLLTNNTNINNYFIMNKKPNVLQFNDFPENEKYFFPFIL
jgi:hypothetical protein